MSGGAQAPLAHIHSERETGLRAQYIHQRHRELSMTLTDTRTRAVPDRGSGVLAFTTEPRSRTECPDEDEYARQFEGMDAVDFYSWRDAYWSRHPEVEAEYRERERLAAEWNNRTGLVDPTDEPFDLKDSQIEDW
jgi:hypothetical protein